MNTLEILPPVDEILNTAQCRSLCRQYGQMQVKSAIRAELQKLREQHVNATSFHSRKDIINHILNSLHSRLHFEFRIRLDRVINATGIILHTGLGRAPLSESAQEQILNVIKGYSNIELDLETGKRGDRTDHVRHLICKLTNAEDALVVNNNAAAVFLSLNTLAQGKKVLVSRGELVEIGGSFRIPDIMNKSGVIMQEVGTTNKTNLSDFAQALSENTGAIFVAHTSNYRIIGFTEHTPLYDLCQLAQEHSIPVIHDLGAGVLGDLTEFDLPYEPLVQDSLKAGADVVTFSGDKVLGGPQSGIIAGSRKSLEKIAENPLMRAVRCDKLVFAGLEATLKLFFAESFPENHKTMALLTASSEKIREKASYILSNLSSEVLDAYSVKLVKCSSQMGSGALPTKTLPSWAVTLKSQSSADQLSRALRKSKPPVLPYIQKGRVFLNMRTVQQTELDILIHLLNQLSLRE